MIFDGDTLVEAVECARRYSLAWEWTRLCRSFGLTSRDTVPVDSLYRWCGLMIDSMKCPVGKAGWRWNSILGKFLEVKVWTAIALQLVVLSLWQKEYE